MVSSVPEVIPAGDRAASYRPVKNFFHPSDHQHLEQSTDDGDDRDNGRYSEQDHDDAAEGVGQQAAGGFLNCLEDGLNQRLDEIETLHRHGVAPIDQ